MSRCSVAGGMGLLDFVRDRHGATGRRRRLHIVLLLPVMVLAAGVATGCGDDESPAGSEAGGASTTGTKQSNSDAAADPTGKTLDATSQPRDARITIAMKDIAFTPEYLTARNGQTLVFSNEDNVPHKIEGDEGQEFLSKSLNKGDTFEVKIKQRADQPNMAFKCTIHPAKMQGGVVVTK
jgi:plastocyanin